MQASEIRPRRRQLGLTQIELAKKVGVSLMTLQLWERGGMNPSEENARKLEEVLNGGKVD